MTQDLQREHYPVDVIGVGQDQVGSAGDIPREHFEADQARKLGEAIVEFGVEDVLEHHRVDNEQQDRIEKRPEQTEVRTLVASFTPDQ